MSYFQPYIDASGIHIPTYTDTMNYLVSRYKAIMSDGNDEIYLGNDSMDYQMLSIYAKTFIDACECLVESYTMRDPDYAYGTGLDYILPLNGITRIPASASTALVTITGVAGTTLTAGKQCKDVNGYLWKLIEDVTIDTSGTSNASVICMTTGAIIANPGEICYINTPTSGWLSVINPSACTVGRDVETDADVKARRSKSVALASTGTLDAIYGAIENVDGVDKLAVYENSDSSTDANGMPAHSICVVVSGGRDDKIAEQIWKKKSPGVRTYGSTTFSYIDNQNNSNAICFSRPVSAPMTITLTLKKLSGWNESYQSSIKQAVSTYIESLNIADDLVLSMLYSIAFSCCTGAPAFSLMGITATKNGASVSTDTVPIAYNEVITCPVSAVTLVIS